MVVQKSLKLVFEILLNASLIQWSSLTSCLVFCSLTLFSECALHLLSVCLLGVVDSHWADPPSPLFDTCVSTINQDPMLHSVFMFKYSWGPMIYKWTCMEKCLGTGHLKCQFDKILNRQNSMSYWLFECLICYLLRLWTFVFNKENQVRSQDHFFQPWVF